MIGEILIDRYTIESELGRGGMGIVYQAQDTLLNRAVAIKFMNTTGIDTHGKTRLLQEARAVAQLNHPNIVSVYDAGEAAGVPFIVMELVRGKTLRKIEKPALPDALRMAQQICQALAHAHEMGIIHRDLKPENIIITGNQALKLMDFGLARTADNARLTQEDSLVGTFAYLAPELIQGDSASVQSDLYAFGIIFYELLLGHAPFQGTMNTVLSQHIFGNVAPPSVEDASIPAWIDDLILRLLNKRPHDRPASAQEVIDLLEQKVTPLPAHGYQEISKQRTNLPSQLTSFIGREKEIAEVKQALAEHRLVTLTGTGGTGKTRLSLEAAAGLLDEFEHGVWLVELAPLTDPELIPQTILAAIGIQEQQGKPSLDTLNEYFREKQALILLDNCEHLISASAHVVKTLLNAAPRLKVLASSREALGIIGEASYPVPSLSLPDVKQLPAVEQLSQYESVRLFMDRAVLVAPRLIMDENNAPFIAQICHRLDGIPLAIELAAARVKMMSVDQISKRLDDRFRLLTGGARTALPRQRTLQALIDWSYDSLAEKEKLLLCRLSVFAGGWTVDAAEVICTGSEIDPLDVLDLLTQLINKSLVIVSEHSQSGETRYRMLETIRQYAQEKLLEAGCCESIHDRHLAYFAKLAEQAEPELHHSNQAWWLNKLEDELDNLRMALEWALMADVRAGLRLAVSSRHFWSARGYARERGNWLGQLLERDQLKDSLHARAMVICAWSLTDLKQARGIAEEALQLARQLGDKQTEAFCLMALGINMSLLGNLKEGTPLVEQSRALYESLGDKYGQSNAVAWLVLNTDDLEQSKAIAQEGLAFYREMGHLSGIAICLSQLAHSRIWVGDFSNSGAWLEEARQIYCQLGHRQGEIEVLDNLGTLALWQGNYRQACTYYRDAMALAKKIGYDLLVEWSRVNMAYAELRQGNIARAKELFVTGARHFQKANNVIGVTYALEGLASLSVCQDQFARAAQLFIWSDAIRKEIGDRRPPAEQNAVENDLRLIRSKVDDARFEELSAQGRAMTMEQALALALEESPLGDLH